jgi:hypothetical protein
MANVFSGSGEKDSSSSFDISLLVRWLDRWRDSDVA